VHSEFNASETEPLHFLQIWILPESEGIEPGYEQRAFEPAELRNKLKLIASPRPSDGAVKIHQDVEVYASLLDRGEEARFQLGEGRHGWVHVARGQIELNGKILRHGDGAAISEERELRFVGNGGSEFLLFDLR
jgi:redox-sensitive bicupin YhaK (pirin superfamily)